MPCKYQSPIIFIFAIGPHAPAVPPRGRGGRARARAGGRRRTRGRRPRRQVAVPADDFQSSDD